MVAVCQRLGRKSRLGLGAISIGAWLAMTIVGCAHGIDTVNADQSGGGAGHARGGRAGRGGAGAGGGAGGGGGRGAGGSGGSGGSGPCAVNAIQFDGSATYATTPRLVQDDFTLEAWIRTTTASPTGTSFFQGVGL